MIKDWKYDFQNDHAFTNMLWEFNLQISDFTKL